MPPRDSKPLSYFELFFTFELLTLIVQNTNKYANALLASKREHLNAHPCSRFHAWKPTTVEEIKKYLAIIMNMGLVRKKDEDEYWAQHPYQETPGFGRIMARNRFQLLGRMLHLNDPAVHVPRGQEGFDPWAKVRPVYDVLNSKFKEHYVLSQDVCIDESLIGMKNRVTYIQYIPNKRHSRFGIKKFELCESKTGYVSDISLYAGKDFDERSVEGQSHAVVVKLMSNCSLLNKGYHLTTDNFYTKPKLAQDLFLQKTYLTGTVRANSKGLPDRFKTKKKLKVGEKLYARNQELLLCAFRDKKSQKKNVLLLSSKLHARELTSRNSKGKEATKPEVVVHYNSTMGGIDLSDKVIYHYSAERSCRRYWRKIFFNFLDIALFNASVLYTQNSAKPVSRYLFLCSIVEDLIDHQEPPQIDRCLPTAHRLEKLPPKQYRDCQVCSKGNGRDRKRSSFICAGCNSGVCQGCFGNMDHTRVKHSRKN